MPLKTSRGFPTLGTTGIEYIEYVYIVFNVNNRTLNIPSQT